MQVSSYTGLPQQKKKIIITCLTSIIFLNRKYDTRGDS